MQSNTAIKFAPAVTDERRIDLAIDNDEAVIQLSDWTEGLGWCTQKTLRVDLELLDEMHRLIAAARTRIRNSKIDSGEQIENAKVLQFPKFS